MNEEDPEQEREKNEEGEESLFKANAVNREEEAKKEEGRVCGGMRDTVERVRMRTLAAGAHLQRWAHRHI